MTNFQRVVVSLLTSLTVGVGCYMAGYLHGQCEMKEVRRPQHWSALAGPPGPQGERGEKGPRGQDGRNADERVLQVFANRLDQLERGHQFSSPKLACPPPPLLTSKTAVDIGMPRGYFIGVSL